jgi:hypothetical protein
VGTERERVGRWPRKCLVPPAWPVRPVQPLRLDPRTGERVSLLFCLRARRVAREYLNHALIPALCRKAGVPRENARGRITSHRARSTIASQL